MRKPLLLKRVRYLKKLAEKCCAALKSVMFMNDFGNFNKKCRAGLHNSESSKGQIDQHKLAAGRKSLFRHRVEEILKGQVITRSRAFATFSATEFLQAACGPRAVCCAGLV